VLAGLKAISKV